MFIFKVTFQMGRDFCAVMACEHCGSSQDMSHGYDDSFFHDKVIPAMCCKLCGKDRSGAITGRREGDHVDAGAS